MAATEGPLDQLERSLIAEFLQARGFDPQKLADLPRELRERLLKDASAYASAKLTEVEARARYLHEIHDVPPGRKSGVE